MCKYTNQRQLDNKARYANQTQQVCLFVPPNFNFLSRKLALGSQSIQLLSMWADWPHFPWFRHFFWEIRVHFVFVILYYGWLAFSNWSRFIYLNAQQKQWKQGSFQFACTYISWPVADTEWRTNKTKEKMHTHTDTRADTPDIWDFGKCWNEPCVYVRCLAVAYDRQLLNLSLWCMHYKEKLQLMWISILVRILSVMRSMEQGQHLSKANSNVMYLVQVQVWQWKPSASIM